MAAVSTQVQRLDQPFAVEGVGHGLPHREAIERRPGLVHAQRADVERRPLEDLEASLAQGRYVGWVDRVVPVDLPVSRAWRRAEPSGM